MSFHGPSWSWSFTVKTLSFLAEAATLPKLENDADTPRKAPSPHGEGFDSAVQYLERDCEVTYRGWDVVIGRRRERLKPGLDVEYEDQETACLILTEARLTGGLTHRRYEELTRWKRRRPGRHIALFIPRGIDPAKLMGFGKVTVVAPYPLVDFSRHRAVAGATFSFSFCDPKIPFCSQCLG